ncbi:MAG TPA: hypothetical protein VKQ32_28060 [Polyangia bacterium]|nr:hypothetical protein [Polyangia bacterium]
MDDGFVVVGVSPQKDPDGRKLRSFLQSQIALERAQALRDLLIHLLAAASLPLGFLVARSADGRSTSFRSVALAGWLACTIALGLTAAREWQHRRRCAALKRDLGPPP